MLLRNEAIEIVRNSGVTHYFDFKNDLLVCNDKNSLYNGFCFAINHRSKIDLAEFEKRCFKILIIHNAKQLEKEINWYKQIQ
jgi:hypothetical protein